MAVYSININICLNVEVRANSYEEAEEFLRQETMPAWFDNAKGHVEIDMTEVEVSEVIEADWA